MASIRDHRVQTMSEILRSIKLIKMYAWEESFEEKVAGMESENFVQHVKCCFEYHHYLFTAI